MQAVESERQIARHPDVERPPFQRLRLQLLGRCMFSDHRECPCHVTEISPGEAAIETGTCGEVGEKVIAYIDDIGRLEGVIAEKTETGFLMAISASERKRDRLADLLTWLANRDILSLAEDGRHLRRAPKRSDATLVFPDGTKHACRVVDMSLSGAALATSLRPPLGSPVRLGRIGARVARHFEDGIGIEFMRLMSQSAIEQSIEKEYF